MDAGAWWAAIYGVAQSRTRLKRLSSSSSSIKIRASGFEETLKSIFCILLVVEAFSLQKSCQDAWKSGSRLVRGE